MPKETIFIDNEITGILTYPDRMNDTSFVKCPGVLMLHGFGSNKDEVEGIYQNIAQKLLENNIASLRIDFRGYGDSPGDTQALSIDDMILDAIKAFNHLCTLPIDRNNLCVIGFSLGAAIALLLSNQVSFSSLVLISPALNLEHDFLQFLGESTMSDLSRCADYIEVDLQWRKIAIGKSFYDSLKRHDTSLAAANFNGNLLCIAGSNDFSAENARIISSFVNHKKSPTNQAVLEITPNADHIFNLSGLPAVASKVSECVSLFSKPAPHTQRSYASNIPRLSQ